MNPCVHLRFQNRQVNILWQMRASMFETKCETKSNWDCVANLTKEAKPLEMGDYVSYWFHKTPRRMLHSLSYYKFASKLIGRSKRVLDVGCNEGLGTYLLAKQCGFACGVDFDKEAITVAKNNFNSEPLQFYEGDILNMPSNESEKWDALVSFDVIEHIAPHNAESFLKALTNKLSAEGLAIIGTPSLISQNFASEVSKQGHINIYSAQRLEETMRKHFSFVFMFAANDEMVHTGYLELAHYFIAVGCKKK
jgi:2-polyprenyl-3-methyl-5-hydroxy-6-metoxy-1,4-benzoquinol methylase